MNEARPGDVGRGLEERFYSALLDDDPAELYENAPCGYITLIGDGTIVKANQTFLTWVGYRRSEIVGSRRFSDLLPTGDRIFYETHLDPLLRMQGRAREIALELVVRDGTRLPVIANAVVDGRRADAPGLTRVVVFDATERRAYERELVDQRRRAEASEARTRETTKMLEASLFPPKLPAVAGLDIAAAYRPASNATRVGGDFYDVFEQRDGSLVVVVGDVVGKGARAAALTSLARHVIRTEALRTNDPAAILAVVAEAFLRYEPDDFCTAMVGVIDPSRRRADFSTGGHPLPLRMSARGGVDKIGERGRVLGMLPEPRLSRFAIRLEPGDTVLLYTDGVTDAHGDSGFYGETGLVSTLREHQAQDARSIVDGLTASVIDFQSRPPYDDIVMVALKVLDPSG